MARRLYKQKEKLRPRLHGAGQVFIRTSFCTDRACVYTIPPYPYKYLFVYPDKNLYCYESVQVVNLYG